MSEAKPGCQDARSRRAAADCEGAGVVIGARVPILLTSRADDERPRLFSCAVAVLYGHWQATGASVVPPQERTP